ncbi:Ada metal-binding domain-containing protein [Kitasatospora mediocidica]|uniref:Ada metal-binding domain-containing protein n=1 Tax=Kitasatospora mediocidica TaxID=58352 RepID=UPI000ADB0ECF|nr:Ada metal-binding domain-containing protein [Kitasatospora mediocidica]
MNGSDEGRRVNGSPLGRTMPEAYDAGPATGLVAGLAELREPAPAGFAALILERAGVPAHRYDRYLAVPSPVGALYVAHGRGMVTGSAAVEWFGTAEEFETAYRTRTGRSAVAVTKPPPGLLGALRTGRDRVLRYEFGRLGATQIAVLEAVRAIPFGQLRPAAWLLREVGGALTPEEVWRAVRANPAPALIPTHRLSLPDGTPADCGLPTGFAERLREREGVDEERVDRFARAGARFLGSGTTRIFCYPTCAHARRITARHEVPFASADQAGAAGFRACLSCRPVAA